MEHFPKNASQTLPPHAKLTHRGVASPCPGHIALGIQSDVGVWYAHCGKCKGYFVYIPKKDIWVEEEIFEKSLQKETPLDLLAML